MLRISLNERTLVNTWLKRFGVGAFCFFLIKGLLWLIIPAAIVAWRAMS